MNNNLKFTILSEGFENGVSATCKKHHISRTVYYKWLKRYKSSGMEGLNDIKKEFVPPNKTSPEMESTILNLIRSYPDYGPRAIKYLVDEIGISISESAVYNVMKRNKLTNKKSRIKFATKTNGDTSDVNPPYDDLRSGECLLFWITNYGRFDTVGRLYEYTFFDFKSKVACSRLYDDITFENFEDILAAVAIPVAQTLNFNTNYLCLFQDEEIIKRIKKGFKVNVEKVVKRNSFDVKTHVLNSIEELELTHALRSDYTDKCLTFLLPLIQEGLSFQALKLRFQQYVRDYNISHRPTFNNEIHSPVSYHNSLTNTNLVLPLWAYIEREY